MDCQEYRNHLSQIVLDHASLVAEPESAFDAHRQQCADCSRWTEEQLKLDQCIADWTHQVPAVDLTHTVVETYLREENLRSSSNSKERKVASRKLAISRRGLATLVASFAATLVFVVVQFSIDPRQVFDHVQVATNESSETDPVASIVSSVRNVVGNVTVSPSAAVAKLPQASLIPDLQVGTLQFSGGEPRALVAPRWTNVREDLQPLETEVRQAFSFIWSALPEEEI